MSAEASELMIPLKKAHSEPLPRSSLDVEVEESGGETVINGRRVSRFSAVPKEYKRPEVEARPPAKEYPFTLDPFQELSISFIEAEESVLVAAHTSAGKTVMAEYAIAKSLRDGQRVVYTSPIKALSNQKFRDMQAQFQDVGLMTGDISINPNAKCLIMTTEILRSMLYRGAEIMREVAWVIYDEVHYMRDKARGIVWEESIILLPHKIRFVFLSATIPNAQQFACWVAKLHRQPCHVVYTEFRPTPLQHYVFPAGTDGLHLVVDDQNQFREENFDRAMNALAADGASIGDEQKKRRKKKNKRDDTDLYKIVNLIMERGYDPVIVFSFAKKECEGNARALSRVDFTDEAEKELIEQVFVNAIDALADEDKGLPQVQALLPLLKRGIGTPVAVKCASRNRRKDPHGGILGIHHGGMLPTLKEIVEVLFGEGLLKVLFATETFSIGINMPAKTVVFTKCRKYDGSDFRWLFPGEYIQMSGRAGRRGLDARGIVILMVDEKMGREVCKNMIYGEAEPLNSSFHISYNMLLNMMRVEGSSPEFLMRSSFHQYQQEMALPDLEGRRENIESDIDAIEVENEGDIQAYDQLVQDLRSVKHQLNTEIYQEKYVRQFLNRGRLTRIASRNPEDDFAEVDYGWGVILGHDSIRADGRKGKIHKGTETVVEVDVLMQFTPEDATSDGSQLDKGMRPYVVGSGDLAVNSVVPVRLENLRDLSVFIIHSTLKDKDLRKKSSRDSVMHSITTYSSKAHEALDPIEDLRIPQELIKPLLDQKEEIEGNLSRLSVKDMPEDRKSRALAAFDMKKKMHVQLSSIQREIRNARSLVMQDDLKRMRKVLRRLGHADDDDVIQLKGRVACEINSTDELVATELMFNGVFTAMGPEQIAALVSALCYNEKRSEEKVDLPPILQRPFQLLEEAARNVAAACRDAEIDIDTEAFVEKFNPEMMPVLYHWAAGGKFVDLCKMTDAFEGSIIRLIRREEEVLRQLSSASYAIGNMELREKFDEVSTKIKRDIVFAASLYL